jgi:viroplasmin and RNaseH domain-containing protein
MSKFYAVKNGKRPGIYLTWADCQEQTKGFSGAIFKSFSTRVEAENFIAQDAKNDFTPVFNVYTDGSFIGNVSGGAAIVVETKTAYYSCVDGPVQTNNRGELLGIMLALQNTNESVCIHSDSQYSINVLSNNYTARENIDLIIEIKKLMNGRNVKFVYVPAHTGVHYNEIADKYAKIACSTVSYQLNIMPLT